MGYRNVDEFTGKNNTGTEIKIFLFLFENGTYLYKCLVYR